MSRKQRRAAASRQQETRSSQHPAATPQGGPRTPEGKAISSQNAFSHGLTAARLVLPWENQAEFDLLLNQLVSEHQPATATEGILVREMAEQYWRLQRARNREYGLLAQEDAILEQAETEITAYEIWNKQVTLAQRYCTRHERAFHKCLSTLRTLQKERRQAESEAAAEVPAADSTGVTLSAPEFVSQNTKNTISQPSITDPSPAADTAFFAQSAV